jgi:hypothetical protein
MAEFLEQVSGIPSLGFAAHPGNDDAISKHSAASSRKRKPGK